MISTTQPIYFRCWMAERLQKLLLHKGWKSMCGHLPVSRENPTNPTTIWNTAFYRAHSARRAHSTRRGKNHYPARARNVLFPKSRSPFQSKLDVERGRLHSLYLRRQRLTNLPFKHMQTEKLRQTDYHPWTMLSHMRFARQQILCRPFGLCHRLSIRIRC